MNTAIFTPDEFLTVTNTDSMPIEFRWNNRRYVVDKGRTASIPAAAVINKAGDPRSVGLEVESQPQKLRHDNFGDVIWVPSAYQEIKRLRSLYGKHNEGTELSIPEPFPQFEVRDADGCRLYTVLEDQERVHVTKTETTVDADTTRDQRILQIEKELKALKEQQATRVDEIPEDDMNVKATPQWVPEDPVLVPRAEPIPEGTIADQAGPPAPPPPVIAPIAPSQVPSRPPNLLDKFPGAAGTPMPPTPHVPGVAPKWD